MINKNDAIQSNSNLCAFLVAGMNTFLAAIPPTSIRRCICQHSSQHTWLYVINTLNSKQHTFTTAASDQSQLPAITDYDNCNNWFCTELEHLHVIVIECIDAVRCAMIVADTNACNTGEGRH